MTRAPLALAATLVLSGCISFSAGAANQLPDLHEYDLAAPREAERPAGRPGARPGRALQVARFGVSEVIDRQELVWRKDELAVGAYSMHRWARPPEEAARHVLAAAVAAARPGLTVATELEAGDPGWVLEGHLVRCEEVDRGDRWFAVLELHLVLEDARGQELLRRAWAVEEDVHPRNPPGVVAALRRALLRVAEEAGDELARAIAASPEPRQSGK